MTYKSVEQLSIDNDDDDGDDQFTYTCLIVVFDIFVNKCLICFTEFSL